MLNILVYSLLSDEFKDEYPTITKMLLYYNTDRPILKTTYKIKNINEFLNTFKKFLSFHNYDPAYDIFSQIVGKLSRNTYLSFTDSRKIYNFPLAKLETDIVRFYNSYFDDDHNEEFEAIKNAIDEAI
jgi:hypothetical protein